MTIVVVRDGVMAVDSRVSAGSFLMGDIQKWREAPSKYGGGFVAGVGFTGEIGAAMDGFISTGADVICKDAAFIHLMANGVVRHSDGGPWFEPMGDFHAAGSGRELAIGAMAMGASALKAAEVACDYCIDCGGNIEVLKI